MIPDIFKKDWFDGRTVDAISADDSKRIGWDDELTNYSEFLFNETYLDSLTKDRELILQELNKILEAMNVSVSLRFSVPLGFDKNAVTAYTDGNRIVIDGKFIPNKNSSSQELYSKFDVLIGLLIHEACHCKYTDFEYCSKNRNLLNPIIHSIHNILEDECIERNIGLSFPGYSNFIKATKIELFKRQLKKKDMTWNIDELQDIFNLLLITVRYPEKLNIVPETVLEQHSEIFEKIKDILDFKGILKRKENVNCTRDTVSAAIAIFNLLNIDEKDMSNSSKNLNIDLDIKAEPDKKDNNNGNASGNGEGSESDKNTDGNSDNNNMITTSGRIPMGGALVSLENSALNANDISNINSESETISSEQSKEILKRILKNMVGSACEENTNTIFDPVSATYNEKIIEKKKSNKLLYNRIYGRISKYVKDFKKIVIPYGTNDEYKKIDFQRTGQVDPNQLVNALTGGIFVNTRIQKHIVNNVAKYAFVINIDEGNSMKASCTHNCEHKHKQTTHEEMATELTILIYEALSNYCGIELYVYGSGHELHKYITPKNSGSKYTITAREQQNGKDFLTTAQAIISDVRKQTNLPIIMLNLTDSFYATSNRYSVFNDFLKRSNATAVMINVCTFNDLEINGCPNPQLIEYNNNLFGEDGWVQNTQNDTFEELAEKLGNAIKSKYRKRNFKK